MRKYAIPKISYILLVVIISCLTIGYTYAYFSAVDTATNTVTLGKISVLWKEDFEEAYISSLFGENKSAIYVDSNEILTRGEYTTMRALLPKANPEDADKFINLSLAISNDFDATAGAYCRIQIVAKYKPNGSETSYDCEDGWVQLGLNSKLITQNGWFEDKGYYYYGKVNTTDADGNITKATLTELTAGGAELIANQLYLSPDTSPEVLGSTMSIMLVLDGVQTTNGAYQQVWKVSW